MTKCVWGAANDVRIEPDIELAKELKHDPATEYSSTVECETTLRSAKRLDADPAIDRALRADGTARIELERSQPIVSETENASLRPPVDLRLLSIGIQSAGLFNAELLEMIVIPQTYETACDICPPSKRSLIKSGIRMA